MPFGRRIRVADRVSNTRRTIRREVGIVRDFVGDLKERIDADVITEPRTTRRLGGTLGRRGSLVKSIPAAFTRTLDNVIEHQQNFARINRLHLHR